MDFDWLPEDWYIGFGLGIAMAFLMMVLPGVIGMKGYDTVTMVSAFVVLPIAGIWIAHAIINR